MQVFDERDKPPCPTCQRKTATGPPVDWRASLWLLIIVGALVGLLLLATGCSPLRGPATSTARPEAGLSAITPAAEAATGEMTTVEGEADTITQQVAGTVEPLREAAKTAPGPVAKVNQAHQVISRAATTAKAAAGQARQQVATITASAGQAEAELARYRQEVEAERAAWAKEREDWQEREDSSLRGLARWGQVAGGLCIAAGVALLFVLRGAIALPVALMSAGGVLLALSSLLYRWAAYVPYIGLAMLLAVAGAAAYMLRRRQQQQALADGALSAAVTFGEQVKAGAPAEVVADAKAWAKANLPKEIRDRIWQELPNESARKQ